jgi:hypothetical protein
MPFGLKNAPSKFHNIMNDIFNPFTHFTIVYIDDVFIFSKSIEEYWKHLNSFLDTIKHNGLVVLAKRINIFKPRLDSLVMIFLRDKYAQLIEPSNLLISFLMSSLTKPNFKDFLVL